MKMLLRVLTVAALLFPLLPDSPGAWYPTGGHGQHRRISALQDLFYNQKQDRKTKSRAQYTRMFFKSQVEFFPPPQLTVADECAIMLR